MTKIPVVFFCGEQSPWGLTHLESLLKESRFRVVSLVLATQERWAIFRNTLSGDEPTPTNWRTEFKRLLKQWLRFGTPIGNHHRALYLARHHNIPVISCHDVNSAEAIVSFKQYSREIAFSAAYPQIFKSELLAAFPRGAFNSHPSLLPRCRGAHPVFWAIASGETQTGATIHVMTTELDKGGIVAQIPVPMNSSDTRATLYQRLNATVPLLLEEFANYLTTPGAQPIPQNDSEATYFRNDRLIHRRIFWGIMSASQIHNLVRACDGSAYFWIGRHRVYVVRVKMLSTNRNLTNDVHVPGGTIVDIDNGKPVIMTRNGLVKITEMRGNKTAYSQLNLGCILS